MNEATTRTVAVRSGGMISPPADSAGAALRAIRAGAPPSPAAPPTLADDQLAAASGLPPREVRKLDRFSLLAVAAARRALDGSGLTPEGWRGCGVLTGNMLAGWTFTEPQLAALHLGGAQTVSPYLATAWFPAAPQGQITIHLGLTGFAKTLTTDRCAGAQAVALAGERIAAGRDGLLLAGGVEAPKTPLVETALRLAGDGRTPLGEGAAYLLLGPSREGGVALTTCAERPTLDRHPAAVVHELLSAAGAGPLAAAWPPFAGVLANLPADPALEAAVGDELAAAPLTADAEVLFPTRIFGETFAASGPLCLVAALEWLRDLAPPASVAVLSVGSCSADLHWLTRQTADEP
jgi:Beta-ketoacyl synthase, N-terminal domain